MTHFFYFSKFSKILKIQKKFKNSKNFKHSKIFKNSKKDYYSTPWPRFTSTVEDVCETSGLLVEAEKGMSHLSMTLWCSSLSSRRSLAVSWFCFRNSMLSKVSLDGPSFFPGFLGSYILFLALTSSSSSAFLTGVKNSHSSFRQYNDWI